MGYELILDHAEQPAQPDKVSKSLTDYCWCGRIWSGLYDALSRLGNDTGKNYDYEFKLNSETAHKVAAAIEEALSTPAAIKIMRYEDLDDCIEWRIGYPSAHDNGIYVTPEEIHEIYEVLEEHLGSDLREGVMEVVMGDGYVHGLLTFAKELSLYADKGDVLVIASF